MPLVRMALTGYRCFARRQDIELNPVTVVLGKNNSGKSALVRAPVVLSTGIRSASPEPLDLDRLDAEMLDSFSDLVYGATPYPKIDVEVGLADEDGSVAFSATVLHVDERRTEVVTDLTLYEDGMRRGRLELAPDAPGGQLRYTVAAGDDATWDGIAVRFEGMLPAELIGALADSVRKDLLASAQHIRDSYPHVRYLGPFRKRPERRLRLPVRTGSDVGIAGEHAPGILASDAARDGGRLVRHLNEEYGHHFPGWHLAAVEPGASWSIVLISNSDPNVQVNIADSGTGVAQVLPILVQRAIDVHNPPARPVLEIVEQPELHLHPAGHADLADVYLDTARHTSTRFLIETHSETLLLRLRRRIAEGVDPSTVAVYFVGQGEEGATARRIWLDEDGNLDYWPEGVFTEDYDETRALARAQWERRDAGAR
jgi:Protein of unknown function (DUF3696)